MASASLDRMGAAEVTKFLELARTLTEQRFTGRFPWDFFVIFERAGVDQTIQYATRTGAPALGSSSSSLRDILPLQKSTASTSNANVIVVGRSRACDVVLADSSVSKIHARIRLEQGRATSVEDAGSHNGTTVSTVLLTPKVPTPVRRGSAVAFGTVAGIILDAAGLRDLLLVR